MPAPADHPTREELLPYLFENAVEETENMGIEDVEELESADADTHAYAAAVEEAGERRLTENFSALLMRHIEARGMDAVTVYKRANIDRKLFSKIKTNIDYLPSKKTVLALAIALELSHEETLSLLKSAGYTLSSSILSDVIIEFFITHGKYDLSEINAALYACGQPVF